MKKIIKRVSLVVTLIMIFSGISIPSYAVTTDKYVETHEEINLEHVNISVRNNNQIVAMPDDNVGIINKLKAKRSVEKLNEQMLNNSQVEQFVLDSVLSGEQVGAISYTIAPVTLVDGHWERVEKQPIYNTLAMRAYATSKESGTSAKGDFTLYSKVTKDGTRNTAGEYKYVISSFGTWSSTSVLGGENHQASGEDFAYILVPDTMTISANNFLPTYWYKIGNTDKYYGRSGYEFWNHSAYDQYAGYKVVDDPLGINQLHLYTLSTICYGTSTTATRRAYGYYIHTWKELYLDVSLSINIELEPELNFDPSIDDKSWQLCNPISFNF